MAEINMAATLTMCMGTTDCLTSYHIASIVSTLAILVPQRSWVLVPLLQQVSADLVA